MPKRAKPAWLSAYQGISGPRDVRALYALSYAMTNLVGVARDVDRRVQRAATIWSLYRQHGYDLRGRKRD